MEEIKTAAIEGWEQDSPLEIQSLRKRTRFKEMISGPEVSFARLRQALSQFAVEDESGELQVINYQEGTGVSANIPVGMDRLSDILDTLQEIEDTGSFEAMGDVKNNAVIGALYELRDKPQE